MMFCSWSREACLRWSEAAALNRVRYEVVTLPLVVTRAMLMQTNPYQVSDAQQARKRMAMARIS